MSDTPPQLAPPAVPTLAQVAVDELQDSILSGRLAAGAPLRLEETAHALGMSPSPVREALRELGRLGLVVNVPHKGAHVAELSHADLTDTYAVRTVLEAWAVEVAAGRFRDDDRAACERHLEAYEDALGRSAMRDARAAHAAFHFGLYTASGSPWLLRSIRPVWENSERYRFMTAASVESLQQREIEHRDLLAACATGDGRRAAALLREHLANSLEHVSAHMRSLEPPPGEVVASSSDI